MGNQRTFYNLKGIGRGLELVLNDVPCPTVGQSQTELLKQQREQLAQEKAKEWKIPQWVEDEERERRKKKIKNKNRKIEETKNQKTKKISNAEAQEEIKNEIYTEKDEGVIETVNDNQGKKRKK